MSRANASLAELAHERDARVLERRKRRAAAMDNLVSGCALFMLLFPFLYWWAPSWMLLILFVVLATLVGSFAYEAITRRERDRQEVADAKARARRIWRRQGFTDADIDRWEQQETSRRGGRPWWWVGRYCD